ncbi:DUF6779 domain-containing protein [Candidatus Mycobacterium methanotrophicum]|uniref:DUF6779 domain-containing protein n=1 Tax=Candidatus Mycobacterium methanotrophicum TaxID=2943498 RepID=A0ABY4QLD5_9MYCO|nr:DUF6779 domain-containing protein [Candidatus Mycobacterium methanotrophicum]UQX10614.1 hypothetical protein M5I08_21720 [Candidatus Mycobacterium methanotrophicum]
MTDQSRGARVRRGGRRPGWALLTALLVLAIGASSALVFTNRAELLRLAVILALWAAVVAAFVSVIYRRQSDVDQARARDLKLVYDLQLDREISARREYELTVESQLRRELASELRAQSADEVSVLRAELAALRTNLEILFDAELSELPALETERRTVRGYSDWDTEHESARERVNRVTSVRAEEPRRVDDSSIIDVPEEPLVPPLRQPVVDSYQVAPYAYQPAGAREAEADRDTYRRRDDQAVQDQSTPPTGWPAQGTPPATGAQRQPEWSAPGAEARRREEIAPGWQPVSSEGQRLPPGTAGGNWIAESADSTLSEPASASPVERRGRHSGIAETGQRPRSRHSADDSAYSGSDAYLGPDTGGSAAPPPVMSPPPPPMSPSPQSPADREPAMSPPPTPTARHRSTDALDTDAPPSGGQSVAELLARLQPSSSGGGRRRRRED